MASAEAAFPISFYLDCLDTYQDKPHQQSASKKETLGEAFESPVIRIFGTTDHGETICAHVHGVLPYMFIPYNNALDSQSVESYILSLQSSINYALAHCLNQNPHDPRNSYVAKISLCKGIPFYGYNVGWKMFLKIYLYRPSHISRLADLLRQGVVLGGNLEPFEAHVPLLAQFMMDFNLYGCGLITCTAACFRYPIYKCEDLEHTQQLLQTFGIDSGDFEIQRWEERDLSAKYISRDRLRVSHCTLEIDIEPWSIANRYEIRARNIHTTMYEGSQILEGQKLVNSLADLWKEENLRSGIIEISASIQSGTESLRKWELQHALHRSARDSQQSVRNHDLSVEDSPELTIKVPTAFELLNMDYQHLDQQIPQKIEEYLGCQLSTSNIRFLLLPSKEIWSCTAIRTRYKSMNNDTPTLSRIVAKGIQSDNAPLSQSSITDYGTIKKSSATTALSHTNPDTLLVGEQTPECLSEKNPRGNCQFRDLKCSKHFNSKVPSCETRLRLRRQVPIRDELQAMAGVESVQNKKLLRVNDTLWERRIQAQLGRTFEMNIQHLSNLPKFDSPEVFPPPLQSCFDEVGVRKRSLFLGRKAPICSSTLKPSRNPIDKSNLPTEPRVCIFALGPC